MKVLTVLRNNKGLSLIEVIVAMFFLSIVLLALAYTYVTITEKNLKQAVRGQSEQISQNIITRLKNMDFGDIESMPTKFDESGDASSTLTSSNLRGLEQYCNPDNSTYAGEETDIPFRNFNVKYETVYKIFDTTTSGYVITNAKTIIITVCWKFKGELNYTSTKTVIWNHN